MKKDLSKVSTWELQKEIDKREAFVIGEVLEMIDRIKKNYNMGLIDPLEAITQIADISKAKRDEYFSNLKKQ